MAAATVCCAEKTSKMACLGFWMHLVPLTASFFYSLQFAGGTEKGEGE